MADEPIQTTILVKHQSGDYEFKIPSLHDEIAVGARMDKIHRAIDPTWNGFTRGMDLDSEYALRAAAVFEVLLKKASVQWPFEATPAGPIVNSALFPPDKALTVMEVWQGYNDSLATFRQGGNSNKPAAPTETVASQ
jgi:hypothetical protein